MASRIASVVDTAALGPRLRRVRLRVDDIAGLDVAPGGDSAVGVYFSAPAAADQASSGDAVGRTYTVRHLHGDVVTLDVVVHADGPGSRWARTTRAGDLVTLDHARSWYRPPTDTDWQIVAADLSGLPAAARIVEALPDGMAVILVLEVAERADLAYLPPLPAAVRLLPLIGTGNGLTPSRLGRHVTGLELPTGRGYCWFAGEAGQSRLLRKYLRRRGWTVDELDAAGYWRQDSEAWDARFARVGDDMLAVYESALAAGLGAKLASEQFDDALERAGL